MSVASANHLFADSEAYKDATNDDGISPYLLERRRFYTDDSWQSLLVQLGRTTTLYVGNLSFFTTEEQLLELFTRVGPVRRLIMGLNKLDKTPCGFAFVEYFTHGDAQSCQRFLSGCCCVDDRIVRADLDPGFEEGRQFGRSRKSGGQRRDDFRAEFDAGRGGWAPVPQPDVYLPLYQDHPVGTTTVAVKDGAANVDGISSAAARERAAQRGERSRSREPQRDSSTRRRRSRSDSRSPSRSRSRSRERRRERARSPASPKKAPAEKMEE